MKTDNHAGDERKLRKILDSRFLNSWKDLVLTVLNARFAFFLGLTIFVAYKTAQQTDKSLIAGYATLVSILAGIAGGVFSTEWTERTERGLLYMRGKLAVLNLKVILNNVNAIQTGTRTYLSKLGSSPI